MKIFDFTNLPTSEIGKAMQEDGFFILRNHGIDNVEEMFEVSRILFGRSVDKEDFLYDPSTNSGFLPLRREKLNEAEQDEKEAFNFRQSLLYLRQQALPAQLDREKIWTFMEQCHDICCKLLKALAIALELDNENQLSQFHSLDKRSGTVMRFLHYPSTAADPSITRAGAHTDYGSLTLLFALSGGLEIMKDGSFIPVPINPDNIIVNAGDLLEYWTDRRVKSTLHRVVVEEVSANSSVNVVPDRYSIAYFCHPDDETPLTLIGGKSSSLTALDHLLMRLQDSR